LLHLINLMLEVAKDKADTHRTPKAAPIHNAMRSSMGIRVKDMPQKTKDCLNTDHIQEIVRMISKHSVIIAKVEVMVMRETIPATTV
jgi:hypothetical protein